MTTEPIISNIVRAAKRPDQSFKIKSNITCNRDRSTFDVEYTCGTTEPSVTIECPICGDPVILIGYIQAAFLKAFGHDNRPDMPEHSPNKLFFNHVETIQEWSTIANEN